MARIIIIGGHGKVALLTEEILTRRGDEVTAMIRNPDQVEAVAATGAMPLVFDIEEYDVDALAELFAGHDAIVWSAGAGSGHPVRTRAVDREAAIRSMDAAEQAGVKRYVMVSYFNSSLKHGVDPEHPFFHYAEAKAIADAYLRQTSLDWTILGPSSLIVEKASGRIDPYAAKTDVVSRGNVAQVIAQTLLEDHTIGRTIRFNEGDVPIDVALREAGVSHY